MTPAEQIEAARQQARANRDMRELEWRELEAAGSRERAYINRFIRPRVRKTTALEYSRWLKGYLDNGGRLNGASDSQMNSHYDDHALSPFNIYTAISDFELPPLFGAFSLMILVPVGVTVKHDGLGHNTLFIMDGHRLEGASGVEVYGDTMGDW